MNKFWHSIFILLTCFTVLLSATTAKAEENSGECSKEQTKKITDAAQNNFKTRVNNFNKMLKQWEASYTAMQKIDGCKDIVKNNKCKGYYLSTDGQIEDILDGAANAGKDLEISLEQWNDISWTDHDYECAANLANEQGNKKCAERLQYMKKDRDALQAQIIELEKEASLITPSNKISCYGCAEGSSTGTSDTMSCASVDKKGNATTGALQGCLPLTAKLTEIKTCLLCPLFQVIVNTDQTMATKSFDALAAAFRNLVIMVMGLYIAYQTLITVSAFTKQDAPKYITSILTQAFKALVAALLLTNSNYIYANVINPLMKAGLEFGISLLFNPTALAGYNEYKDEYMDLVPQGTIGQDLLASVMGTVKQFSIASAELPAIGGTLVCISTHAAAWEGIFPDLSMLIEGLLIYAFGWAIALTVGFYLLDCVVRFGIFCALLPFLIAAWPFKVTRGYTKTGWDIFMNAFFNFVMVGLIISLNSELISQALSGGKGGKDALMAAINANTVETIKELMDISGTDFLILVACCMFAFKLVGEINNLASEISSTSGGTEIGNKIGSVAAQAAKKTAGMAAKTGGAIAKFASREIGLTGAAQNVKGKVASGLNKAGAKIGLGSQADPNGVGGVSGGSDNSSGESSGGNSGGNSGDSGNSSGESSGGNSGGNSGDSGNSSGGNGNTSGNNGASS